MSSKIDVSPPEIGSVMDNFTVTLEEALQVVEKLSLIDKVRLLEAIAPQITQALIAKQSQPRKSLRGLWRGIDTPESDIDNLRDEMWRNFPREDI